MNITYSSFRTKLADAFVEAGVELGYPKVDHNAKDIIFAYLQVTTKNGSRVSSNKATKYLSGARSQKSQHNAS
jgi:hypothetical protein